MHVYSQYKQWYLCCCLQPSCLGAVHPIGSAGTCHCQAQAALHNRLCIVQVPRVPVQLGFYAVLFQGCAIQAQHFCADLQPVSHRYDLAVLPLDVAASCSAQPCPSNVPSWACLQHKNDEAKAFAQRALSGPSQNCVYNPLPLSQTGLCHSCDCLHMGFKQLIFLLKLLSDCLCGVHSGLMKSNQCRLQDHLLRPWPSRFCP